MKKSARKPILGLSEKDWGFGPLREKTLPYGHPDALLQERINRDIREVVEEYSERELGEYYMAQDLEGNPVIQDELKDRVEELEKECFHFSAEISRLEDIRDSQHKCIENYEKKIDTMRRRIDDLKERNHELSEIIANLVKDGEDGLSQL